MTQLRSFRHNSLPHTATAATAEEGRIQIGDIRRKSGYSRHREQRPSKCSRREGSSSICEAWDTES